MQTNKAVQVIIFIAVAIGLVAGGVWYNHRQDQIAADEQRALLLDQFQNQSAPSSAAPNTTSNVDEFKKTDIKVGEGREAKPGDTLVVNYLGTLMNGTKFDSSYDRNQPFEFKLGAGQVIQGWEQGMVGMKIGGKRELIIPPAMAYGAQQVGPIPPNSTLKFTVELVNIK